MEGGGEGARPSLEAAPSKKMELIIHFVQFVLLSIRYLIFFDNVFSYIFYVALALCVVGYLVLILRRSF